MTKKLIIYRAITQNSYEKITDKMIIPSLKCILRNWIIILIITKRQKFNHIKTLLYIIRGFNNI
ncbi:hypothetical protein C671_2404 [[Clostridium] bifermentans ATCC 19299]|nr:hypothetical protein C671_2404 [[Clostridium] bifermentans ATCC 19299] [Paraclostridium bifermentans ATCC 19299]